MKFLKVLINSLLSGFFFSALLALLTLDLNINMQFSLSFFFQLTLFLSIVYGSLIFILCIIFYFIFQFFSGKKINIAFVSPSFLLISTSLLILLYLIIFRENYFLFRSFFSREVSSLLKTQSLILLFLAILGLFSIFGLIKYKRKLTFYLLYFCLFAAVLPYAILQRINYPKPQQYNKMAKLEARELDKRITIIGLGGLSFDFIIPLTSEGKLQNFSWLMEEGTWGRLESFTPNQPILLHNSFNTGKLPAKHGLVSTNEHQLLNFETTIQTVPRYVFFKQLTRLGILKIREIEPQTYMKDIWNIFKENQTPYYKQDWPYQMREWQISPEAETIFNRYYSELRYETNPVFNAIKEAFCRDVDLEAMVTKEREKTEPQLLYFLLPGLNTAERYFYKYSFPELYGEVDQDEINRYSTVIEKYYQYYDEIVGKYLAAKKDDELLVIFSFHGIEPLPLWRRYLEWIIGDRNISAYYDNAPEGVVFFLGKDIRKGYNIEGMKIIDIAPTLLHYLGFPLGRDMDGIVSNSIFVEEFRTENPLMFISTYEEHEIKSPE